MIGLSVSQLMSGSFILYFARMPAVAADLGQRFVGVGRPDLLDSMQRRVGGILSWIGASYQRVVERDELADLSPEALLDAGITPEQVEREVAKYFWQE